MAIGIDYAFSFSFPMSDMQGYGIEAWDQFLDDIMLHWPITDPQTLRRLRARGLSVVVPLSLS